MIPRARKSELAGVRDNALLVRLSAPPVEGAANEALVELLSSVLGVSKRSVHIVAGEKSRGKRVAVDGLTEPQARALLHV